VFGQHEIEYIGTKPARGDGADQHVSVQRDPHDTSRNTSSSVE
jgi:hypothetical protein